MSLRGKIVLLFLGLAVVPLLVVAAYGYWQASQLAREVVGVSLDASVSQVAQELHEGMAEVDRTVERQVQARSLHDLVELRAPSTAGPSGEGDSAAAPTTADPDAATSQEEAPADPATVQQDAAADQASPGSAPSAWDEHRAAWEAEATAALGPLAYLTLRTPGGAVIAEAGARPETTQRCTSSGGSRLETVRRAIRSDGSDIELEAGVWLDDLISRSAAEVGGSLAVFQRNRGTILLSSTCDDLEAGVPLDLQAATSRAESGRVQFDREDSERLASFVTLGNRPWTVAAHARNDTFLAPLQRLQASYWIFVLMLALATVLAFSILLDRVVMSLEDLTAAAAKIGEGELNPWLPPPGSDEVGRLSLAFSGMLERIRQMMQRVDHSGRLAVVGQLTSYLAHEIRNPLSSIRMNLQSLQRDVRRGRIPEDSGEAIAISLREVDRLSSSLTSVLQLGRPSSGPRETVSVHDVVQEASELLTGEFRRSGVELVLELDATADRVRAAPGQLKGVFLNLMMNALEAQPEGGRVHVSSRLVSAPGRGPTVAVHLRDYGRGISPELRERIFEPFFTTKSQGSGIGLAVALRTVREHGGDLFLAELPETSEGAEFVVELPLAAVVSETTPDPSVDLPDWMGAGDPPPSRAGIWSKDAPNRAGRGRFRGIDDAHIRALIELSDSDHGKLH